jgi:prepilin-type N-terminal cleavage/methylation domain-containing protein
MDRNRGEQGFTLVELLVVVVLLGIIGGFTTTAVVTAMNNSRATSQRAIALHDIERSLQIVARELRVADPIYLTANADYAATIGAEIVRDRKIQVHTFTIEEIDDLEYLVQNIVEYDIDDVGAGIPDDVTPISLPQRRLVTDLDNELESVFTYHDEDGSEIDCSTLTVAECEDRYADAAQIGIRLIRNLDGQEPIRAETRVNVRNTRYVRSTT